MSKWTLPASCGVLVAVVAFSMSATAGEPADVKKEIDDLRARLEKLERQEAAKPPAVEKKDSWTDKVTFSGDLRLRGDIIEKPDQDTPVRDYERARLRARINMDVKVNDDVKVRLRLATSEGTTFATGADPVSTNQTMGNEETKKGIYLDIAQATYAPEWAAMLSPSGGEKDRPLEVIGGKMEMPFFKAGGSRNELLWDNDLTPEGGAVRFSPEFGPVQLISTAGMFSTMCREADTTSGSGRDAALFGFQGGLKLTLDKDLGAYILGGAGQFNYTHTEGFPPFAYKGDGNSYGNTKRGSGATAEYVYDYNETELFAEAGVNVPIGNYKIPLVVFGEHVKNSAQGLTQDDEGYSFGAGIGKLKNPGDLAFNYTYRKLERDAVLGAFSGSDDGGGGTDNKGHKYSMEAQLMKNVSAAFTFFDDKVNISSENTANPDNDYRRLQLDINFKF